MTTTGSVRVRGSSRSAAQHLEPVETGEVQIEQHDGRDFTTPSPRAVWSAKR